MSTRFTLARPPAASGKNVVVFLLFDRRDPLLDIGFAQCAVEHVGAFSAAKS